MQPDEQGVELLFGKYVKTTQPGLNYWFPAPIGQVIKPKVTQTNQVTIGFRGSGNNIREVPQESHILAGDRSDEGTVLLAVQMALVGRHYERIADHAVTIAERVGFMVTGEHPSPEVEVDL